ncbi:MAG: hypothetical protein HDR29_01130 [Lachnospiraceae bacterium]|nr:hypothetical protein [Lachnospiraceae bacterium]
MLQKSLEELAQTEGGRTAIKIIKQNKILQIVILILYILNLCFYILMYDHKLVFFIVIAIIFVLWFCAQIYYARIHKILNEECDPFKAEEVYTYYYLSYAKKKLEKKQGASSKWLYHLYISYSVLLQGDFERAFFILNQIDRRELDSSKQYLIFRFHQNMRIYYCYKNDDAVLNNMRNYFVKMSEDKHFKRLYRKWIKKEIEVIDLHCSLNRGDFSVYEYLSRQPEWTRGTRLQRVATHWMDAKVHNMQKNQEAAVLDCQYVIENGNRLWYVSMAKQMLSFIENSPEG